ncbi:MAG: type II toxin-antitoxin system VapC family toxin [Candidatus Omnitrophica bacterium]|nr:type II toxin-antitoxin system VapC family toxin [Candidatus Omnitrophota bacterium]
MIFFLDTDICIFALRGAYPALNRAFRECNPARIKVSAVVLAELLLGVQRSRHELTARKAVTAFLEPFEVVPFDRAAAEAYAHIREDLESKGQVIGPNDLMIAAICVARRATLVTHNTGEFGRVPGLKLQDWTA